MRLEYLYNSQPDELVWNQDERLEAMALRLDELGCPETAEETLSILYTLRQYRELEGRLDRIRDAWRIVEKGEENMRDALGQTP